jgi:hypothetical protein
VAAKKEHDALFKKLRIKPPMSIAVLHAPPDHEERLRRLPARVERVARVRGELDLIHTFASEKRAILDEAPKLAKALKPGGILWVSYPKGKTLPTDLNRDILREALVLVGLEAVSNVAIDETWSALRFKRVEGGGA